MEDMPANQQTDRERAKGVAASTLPQTDDPYATAKLEPRCIQCDALVPGGICGRKHPCPACGYPYPLGDCSDLAEN
jgi:hypothetical protein